MNYKELVKAVATATEKGITKDTIDDLALCAREVSYDIPTCSCTNKWKDLLYHLQIFIKQHPDGFPKWKWNTEYKRLLLQSGKIFLKSNYTDEQVEKWLEENPQHKDYFKLWNNRKKKATKVETEETVKEDDNNNKEEEVVDNGK